MKNDSADSIRAAKLAIAIEELTLQNKNKDKQAAQLLVANKELQNAEEKITKASHQCDQPSQGQLKHAQIG